MLSKEVEIERNGIKFTVFDDARSGTIEAVLGSWSDSDQVDLKDPRIILDVGANVGIWAFYMAKKYPEATIVAIEPLKKNFAHLIEGIKKNRLTNVTAIPVAVGPKPSMTIRHHVSNSGAASACVPELGAYDSEEVICIPLNAIVSQLGHIDLMKLDIEGIEYDELPTFERYEMVGAITMELHPWPRFKTVDEQRHETLELLDKVHYGMRGKTVKFTMPEYHEEDFALKMTTQFDSFKRQLAEVEHNFPGING